MSDQSDDINQMKAAPAVMTMTLQITRAATGKTETVQLVCTPPDVSQQATIEPQQEQ